MADKNPLSIVVTVVIALVAVAAVVLVPVLLSEEDKANEVDNIDVDQLITQSDEVTKTAKELTSRKEFPSSAVLREAALDVEQDRCEDALKKLRPLLDASQSNDEVVEIRLHIASAYGRMAAQQGSPEHAASCIKQLSEVLLLAPDNVAALQGMGMARFHTGDTERGIELLQKAIRLDSGNAELWFQLGRAYAFGGKDDDAKKSWRKALDLEPSHAEAKKALGAAE